MRRTHFLTLLLLLSLLPVSAKTTVETLSKKISAYKYEVSNLFADNQVKQFQFRLLDAFDQEKNSAVPFLLDSTDIGKTQTLCSYIISGNLMKCKVSIDFTPLKADSSYVEYQITVTPLSTKMGNSKFTSGSTIPIVHANGNTDYTFSYSSTEPSAQTATITDQKVTIPLSFSIACTLSPSLSGYPKDGVIDHWTREGTIAINVPVTKTDGSDNATAGTYQANMTFTITEGT